MTAIALEREANNYWNIIKDLSKEVKVALITKLSASLIAETKERKTKAADFSGVWDDAHYPAADDMVREIRGARS